MFSTNHYYVKRFVQLRARKIDARKPDCLSCSIRSIDNWLETGLNIPAELLTYCSLYWWQNFRKQVLH